MDTHKPAVLSLIAHMLYKRIDPDRLFIVGFTSRMQNIITLQKNNILGKEHWSKEKIENNYTVIVLSFIMCIEHSLLK